MNNRRLKFHPDVEFVCIRVTVVSIKYLSHCLNQWFSKGGENEILGGGESKLNNYWQTSEAWPRP